MLTKRSATMAPISKKENGECDASRILLHFSIDVSLPPRIGLDAKCLSP